LKSTGISGNSINVASLDRRGGGEMMKKLIVIGIVAVMVMGLAMVAQAAVDASWVVQFQAFNAINQNSAGATEYGTKTNTSNARVSGEDVELSIVNTSQAEIICVDQAPYDTSKLPRFNKDYRAPLAAPGNPVQTWNLLLFAGDGYPDADIILKGWQPSKLGLVTGAPITLDPANMQVALWYNGEKIWDLNAAQTPALGAGTSAAPQFTKSFAKVGRANAYELQLIAKVPEPGSMLALLSGLVGLVGIRRRK